MAGGRSSIGRWQKVEDHQEWDVLIQRLWERGCQPEQRWQLVVRDGSGGLGEALALVDGTTVREQRCIFHTLHTVGTTCRSERKGKEKRESRKQWMEQAAVVSQAEHAGEAHQRLAGWAKQWQEHAPQSVATLERDVEQTLVFSSLSGLTPEWIRTTSLLERPNRELRRTFRQAVTFGSQKGAEVALSLHVQRLHARWVGQNWWETSQQVLLDLWNLNP